MAIPQYNTIRYNTAQYNAQALYFVQPLADSVTAVDTTITKSMDLVKLETITPVDTRTNDLTRSLVDSSVLLADVTKQITDKRLVETIKENEWFTVKQAPQSDPWS